jgi:hypothetical protein
MISPKNTIDRRQFLEGIAAASGITILPRHVLGGPGYTAPNDRLNIGGIGCGTQALRSVMTGLAERDDIQYTCVCDPNRESYNYVDWSRNGVRNSVREFLGDESWGENHPGIPGGREVARQVLNAYYGQTSESGTFDGVRSYADFRELFAEEEDLDAVVIVTPDHQHATISIAAMKAGVAPIMHKPVANVLDEVRKTVNTARETGLTTHLLAYSDREDYYTLDAWFKAGVIGNVREVHNWSARPYWPQGFLDRPADQPPIPDGFDWDLWLGPVAQIPYHPLYTFATYRGWYDFGGGSMADMGNYSMWFVYRLLDLDAPTSAIGRPNTVSYLTDENVANHEVSQVSFPYAGKLQFTHAAKANRPEVKTYWYSGGMTPNAPKELLDAGEDLSREGMMFVGDYGTIMCGFRGTDPRLLGRPTPDVNVGAVETVGGSDEWITAVKDGTQSLGSYLSVEPLAEATALGGIAYRFPRERLEFDSSSLQITNVSEANELIYRNYRDGWQV